MTNERELNFESRNHRNKQKKRCSSLLALADTVLLIVSINM